MLANANSGRTMYRHLFIVALAAATGQQRWKVDTLPWAPQLNNVPNSKGRAPLVTAASVLYVPFVGPGHPNQGVEVFAKVDGEHFLAMPREIQRDHLLGRFIHVDFLRIARDEKIKVEVPIHLVGESRGVKEGGVVEHHIWNLELESFPQDVPTSVEANISGLGINESLKVADLKLPPNCTVLTHVDEVVVSVVPPQVLRVEEAVPPELAAAEGEEGAGEEAEGGQAGAEGAGQPES